MIRITFAETGKDHSRISGWKRHKFFKFGKFLWWVMILITLTFILWTSHSKSPVNESGVDERVDKLEAILTNLTVDSRLAYLDSLAEVATEMEVQLRLIQERCLQHLRTVIELEERIDQERELRWQMLREEQNHGTGK